MSARLRLLLAGALLTAPALPARAQRAGPFRVEETTIANIHAAMTAGRLTCRALVARGYTRGVLPAGLQLFGRPWSEATLIRLAYGYEQSTHHRHPPESAPPLP